MRKQSITKNYLYNVAYQVLGLVVPLVTTPYVSRVLGASGTGEYGYALSIVSYFSLIGNLGLSTYGQLKIAEDRDDIKKLSREFLQIEITRFVLLSISAIIYFLMILKFKKIEKSIFLIVSLNILATALDISWFFQGLEEFGKIVFRNLMIKIISTCLIFLVVKKSSHVCQYAFVLQGALFLGCVSLWPMILHKIDFAEIHNISLKSTIFQGIVYFIPTIASSVYNVLDKSMIGFFTGESSEVGYYEQTYKVIHMITVVVTSISSVIMPRMVYLLKRGEKQTFENLFVKSVNVLLMLAIPMSAGIVILSHRFIPFYLGNGYQPSIVIFRLLAPMVILNGMTNALGMQLLIPSKKQSKYTKGVVIGAIVNFISNCVCINLFKSSGAAIASVISEGCIMIYFYMIAKEIINFSNVKRHFFRYSLFSMVMVLIMIFLDNLLIKTIAGLILRITLGGAIYLFLLIVFKDDVCLEVIRKLKRIILK